MEIMQMAQKLKHIKLEPGEVLATIGEEVEPALYYISTNSKDAGHIEMTKNDGATHTFVSPQPFGFGKDALIATNLDYHVGALYGKKQNLVKLGTEEEVKAAKRNLLERNVVFSQATVKAVGTDTIHLRKLTLEDIHDIIHDPFRLGKDYQNESRNADISHTTLEKKLLLGQGTFGQVWLCRAPSESPYALKIQYKREIIEQHQAAGVIRETGVMRKMHHPFVMGLINAEQDPQCLYMVTEPHLGGELRQQMRNTDRPNLSESDAKFYAACILEGLSYMHRRDYIYRDLKGENVLLDKDGYCVIIDFGFAKHVPDKTFTFCGTPVFIVRARIINEVLYLVVLLTEMLLSSYSLRIFFFVTSSMASRFPHAQAPEVLLNTGHNKSADLWSFGILIYEMLFGTNPFMDYDDPAIDQRTLFKRIVKASFQRPQKQSALDAYAKTSKNAKDLIKKLLIVKPRKRLGCRGQADLEIRNHPWFSDIDFGKLYRKELTAPWIPKISDPFDSSNFNPKEPKSKAGLKKLKTWEQEKFKDF
jgi:protein kinase A